MKLLTEIAPGDVVTRKFGAIPQRPPDQLWDNMLELRLRVTEVDEQFIFCGPVGIGWKFDRVTGGEVDEELKWTATATGSFIVPA